MIALIHDGKVIQIEGKSFPVSPSLQWVEINDPDIVRVGFSYIDGKFKPPEPVTIQKEIDKRDLIIDAIVKNIQGTIKIEDLTKVYEENKDVLDTGMTPGTITK